MKYKNVQKGNDKFDKRNIWCFNCNKFGYFAVDCWSNTVSKGEEANIVKGDSDDEPVLLITYENGGEKMVDWWYIDTCVIPQNLPPPFIFSLNLGLGIHHIHVSFICVMHPYQHFLINIIDSKLVNNKNLVLHEVCDTCSSLGKNPNSLILDFWFKETS